MDLILDTCTFIWLTCDPDRLSAEAARVLNSQKNEIFLSEISVLEISLKHTSGKLSLPQPPRIWIPEQQAIWKLKSIAIDTEIIFRTTELPTHHRDPFDRLLVSTAITHSMPIVTPDPWIKKYPVSTVW